MTTRRFSLIYGGALALLLAAGAQGALAQGAFPAKTIRWVVPSPAGSPIDSMGRKLADVMAKQLGVSIIVDNKPGASGSIGAAEVARAAPDGYTLMLSTGDPLVFAAAAIKTSYNPQKDFQYITKIGASGPVLVAANRVKANNLTELVHDAKTASTPMDYGSNGPGSSPQQVLESLAKQAGIKLNEIPYKGSPQALQDVMAGNLSMMFTAPAQAAPMIAEGKLKAIAVIGDKRSTVLPKVGTFAEAGFNSFVYKNKVWVGLTGPAGLPAAIVQKLGQATQLATEDPGFKKYMADIGFDVVGSSPDEFRKEVQEEFAATLPLLRDLGVTPQ